MTRPLIRNKPQRILITGDRDWTDRPKMIKVLSKHLRPDRDIIIHGDARGADRMGAEIAHNLSVTKTASSPTQQTGINTTKRQAQSGISRC